MALTQIHLPDIGDFTDVEIIEVLVAKGDTVAVDDSLITLESDKASMEIPSPHAGVIKDLKVKLKDRVSQGDLIAMIEVQQGAAESAQTPAETPAQAPAEAPTETPPAQPVAQSEPVVQQAPSAKTPNNTPSTGAMSHASPKVRKIASQLGVSLQAVTGTGVKNRITEEDVHKYVKSVLSLGAGGTAGIPAIEGVDFSQFGEIKNVPLSRIKKISGKHLSACWLNIPHVTQCIDADITELENFRKAQAKAAEKAQIKLTPLAFIIKAVVATLKTHPNFNASLDGDNLVVKKYYNIGIAVDTPNGLMVPVIRDADQKGAFELAQEMADLSERARASKLTPTDLSGACFSISSLGGIGGSYFTPIVNAPEVAILGVGRSAMQPVWDGEAFAPRLMLPLAVSYDHRVIDGAQGARFAVSLANCLSDIRTLIL